MGQALARRTLSRQPVQPGLPLKDPGPHSVPTQILTKEDRSVIEQQARDHLLAAFTDFVSAVKYHVDSIRAEDKAKAEIAAAMLEIFFGFAAPIFSAKLLTAGGKAKALATKLATSLSTTKPAEQAARIKAAAEAAGRSRQATMGAAYLNEQAATTRKAWEKAAQEAAVRNNANRTFNQQAEAAKRAFDKAQSEATAAGKQSIEAQQAAAATAKARDAGDPVKLITEAEILREGFKGAAKTASTATKINATRLFGETDIEPFARELQFQFRTGVQALTDNIAAHKLSDHELLAVWAAYDVEVANVTTYTEALKALFDEFRKYVRPIGSGDVSYGMKSGRGERKTRAAWIRWAGGKRLALIKDERPKGLGGKISGWQRDFVTWVPERMQVFVIRKTEREFGSVDLIDHPNDEGSIHDLQQIIREGIRDEERKRKEEAEKKAREERIRKAAEQWVKDNPNFGKKPPRTSLPGGNIDEEIDEYLRDTADW